MTDRGPQAIPASVHAAAGKWLARRQGGAGVEVERDFAAWLAADPLHRRAYDEAQRTWRDGLLLADSAVGRARRLDRAPFLMRRSTHAGAAGLGLAAVLGLVTVGAVREIGPFTLVAPAEAATYRTAIGEIRTVTLADGSRVTLDTATVLRATITATGRHVELEQGRARFRVVPDARRPFIVAARGGEIVAQGKVFDVSVTEGPARVAALDGPVELRAADPAAVSTTLASGRQAGFGGGAAPRAFPAAEGQWISGMLGLDATPLGEAVAAINRYNGVQVRLADPGLSRLPVTGAFKVRDPEGFARAVTATFDLAVSHPVPSIIVLTPGPSPVPSPR